MAEATVVKSEQTKPVYDVNRPDFSDFSEPVLSWSLFMANDIKKEDHMSIEFTNLPKYMGADLARGMMISIDFHDYGKINMIVKEINYIINGVKATTSLLLSTQKIFFDTFIPEGLPLGKEGPTTKDVLEEIARHLVIPIKEYNIDPSIKWSFDKMIINGRQNVLDYIEEAFNPPKNPPRYSVWIDAFNTMHVQPRTGFEGEKIDIDFNEARETLGLLNVRLFFDFDEKEVAVTHNLNNPDRKKKSEKFAHRYTANDDKHTEVNSNITPKRVGGGSATAAHNLNSFAKLAVHDEFIRLRFYGIYWVKPHFVAKFKNFPIGDGEYVITNVSITDSAIEVTTDITLEKVTGIMPPSGKKDTETEKKKKEYYHRYSAPDDKATTVVGVEK